MDIRAYIESGVLELYAMGALPQEEAQQVADALARHPELRDELAEISRALETISPVPGKEPSVELRTKILASIPDGAHRGASSREGGGNVIPFDGSALGRPSGSRRYLLAASFVGLLLSASAALWFWSQWKSSEDELADALNVMERLSAANYQAVEELRTLRNYENRMVRMTSTGVAAGKTPGALAVVYWNPETKEVYLDPALMPPLPDGRQYQLWAIADGDPVDVGVFDPAASGRTSALQRMKDVTEVKVFAVTIEPHGGSETPTLETMTVSGQL